MKKLLTLTLALILALSLASCTVEFGGGTSGGGNPTNSKPTSGNSTNSGGDTIPTGDDAISMNALAGLWHTKGYIENYYWSFGADGRFAYYISGSRLVQDGLLKPYASESYFKGSYRVNGNTIEFYNVQYDGFSENYGSFKYFSDQSGLTGDKLLDTPLQEPEKVDDFTSLFEFKNASRLRIVIDRGGLRDNYDWFFDYVGTRGNITIPSHSLPGSAWPRDELPPDLPEYRAGRIMSTKTSSQYYLNVVIDGSTREDFIDFVECMVQSGWIWYSNSTESEFEEFKKGENFKNGSTLNKGAYQVSVIYSVNELNQAEIIWWK